MRKQKGITLIALIITIIVLLILAGISIAALTGKNGILARAKEAKEQTKIGKEDEIEKLSNYEDIIENHTNPEKKKMKLVVNSGINKIVKLPISKCEGNNFTIDWGDGILENVDNKDVGNTEEIEEKAIHTYSLENTEYIVTIEGTLKKLTSYNRKQWGKIDNDRLIEIRQWGETQLKDIYLRDLWNLKKIGSPSKNTFKNMKSFSTAFYNSNIVEIPEDLFNDCSHIKNFSNAFSGTKISEIPSNLFKNCTNATSFYGTFEDCYNITSIPNELFSNCTNVSNFSNTFSGTNIVSIPSNLFSNCPNVVKFKDCFSNTEISEIPEELFKNCDKVEDFTETFCGCDNLNNYLDLWNSSYFNNGNDNVGIDKAGSGCYSYCDKLLENEEALNNIPEFWRTYNGPE